MLSMICQVPCSYQLMQRDNLDRGVIMLCMCIVELCILLITIFRLMIHSLFKQRVLLFNDWNNLHSKIIVCKQCVLLKRQ